MSAKSDSQEDLLAIHPVKRVPVDQQRKAAQHDGFEARAKQVEDSVSHVSVQGGFDEVLPQMRDQVCGDRVRADDD